MPEPFLKPPAERVERRFPGPIRNASKGPWLLSRGKGGSGRKRELSRGWGWGGRVRKREREKKNTDTLASRHARERSGARRSFCKAKEAIARETGSKEARRRAGVPQSRRVDPSRGGGSRSALPRPGCRKKLRPSPRFRLPAFAKQSHSTFPWGQLERGGGGSLAKATMSPDEIVYLVVLLISIPVGFLFKQVGPKTKKYGAAVVGIALILVTCQIHILHSLITILGTWLIINISPRACHHLTLGWTFSYLLFFRTVTYFNYPEPTPFTNAVQLLLTLKLLSLANEVQELIQAKKQEVTTFTKSPVIGTVLQKPGLVEILCYSYCYVGLMTGPFYRYRTYHDWLSQIDPSVIPSWQPMLSRSRMIPIFGIFFLVVSHFFPLDYVRSNAFYERGLPFRLFYMVPIFFVFRMRFYVAWLCAECACISAAFGAYPVTAKSRSGGGPTVEYEPLSRSADGEASSVAYDYETVKNIDPHGTDFCVKVKDGMRYWNMTVQWWLAQYIYKSAPFHSYVMRSAWTMLISAYWHGIHPGYYISFLTIPLCLAAEGAMESGFLKHLSPSGRLWGDWIQWFLKMRAYDYMCMGFVLLTFEDTIRYWSSVYYCVHVGAVFFFLLGTVLGIQRKWSSPKDKQGSPQNPKQQE